MEPSDHKCDRLKMAAAGIGSERSRQTLDTAIQDVCGNPSVAGDAKLKLTLDVKHEPADDPQRQAGDAETMIADDEHVAESDVVTPGGYRSTVQVWLNGSVQTESTLADARQIVLRAFRESQYEAVEIARWGIMAV